MLRVRTVEPGFGGQPFLDLVLPKVRRARELIARHGGEIWLQVDGGVGEETIARCAEAGADVFVAGAAVFGASDPAAAGGYLRGSAQAAAPPASGLSPRRPLARGQRAPARAGQKGRGAWPHAPPGESPRP